MSDESRIEDRFWKELKSSPFVMLGLDGVRDGHTQPMTAQFEGEQGPIWFFANRDNTLVQAMGAQPQRAIVTFTAKGHDIFASIHGELVLDNNAATVDRLWNSQVEAWFEGGKDDPKLVLLRLDTERAQIWQKTSSIFAGIKKLMGSDPKEDAHKNVAEVRI